MKSFLKRLILVAIGQLFLLESVLQFSVHQSERTGKLMQLTVFGFLAVGIIWALMGGFRAHRYAGVWRFLAFVPVFIALYAADSYYSYHIRPNIGFYEDPDWVRDLPASRR